MRNFFGTLAIAALGVLYPLAASAGDANDPTWKVSDQTDNNTGVRTVSALALSNDKIDGDYAALFLDCSAGQPQLTLAANVPLGSDFALVSAIKGTPDDFDDLGDPAAWKTVSGHPEWVAASPEER